MEESSEVETSLGAVAHPEGVRFTLWAPAYETVELLLESSGDRVVMERDSLGYYSTNVRGAGAGARYRYRLGGGQVCPDPASRYQPEGVHGPSEVVDPRRYDWRYSAPDSVEAPTFYELHVGTFSPEGSFAGACRRLPYLADLGVDTIELMPVANFPGRWNWGYDPASFFAPSRAYGTPDELRCLVDDAHGLGLRVILDVVYNHFGPDGAYWPAVDPHTLTSRHQTPWGQAVDFDGPDSRGVRRFVTENALMWLREYRFDGLRLDATFAIVDDSPCHLLTVLAQQAEKLPGPERLLVAEDHRNSRNVVLPREQGGLGLGAVWADDFHHQLRVRLAGDDRAYFRDFGGSSEQIARTIRGNWFYSGHHSLNRGGPRGTPAFDLEPHRFVYCIQNHDQVGNRPDGARLTREVPLHAYRAASALLLFVPQTPLLFMGQEWAAATPFLFFTDFDGELGEKVSAGRREEFEEFGFGGDVPDPQDPETFARSRLDWEELGREPHAGMLRYYRELLRLRRSLEGPIEIAEKRPEGLALRRDRHLLLVAFEGGAAFDIAAGSTLLLDSEDSDYAPDPLPPSLTASNVTFSRASALLLEMGASGVGRISS